MGQQISKTLIYPVSYISRNLFFRFLAPAQILLVEAVNGLSPGEQFVAR